MNRFRSFPIRCVIAALSGAIHAMAFPQPGWGWLVIPGLLGLLLALRGEHGTRARALGFLHGMVAYALSLSWLFQIFGSLVVVLWMVLAAFTALFAEFQGRAGLRGISGWKFVAFTTLNWCGWEFIRAELFPLKFPWMTAGLAVGPNSLLPWIGVHGVGAMVMLAVALLAIRKIPAAAGVGALLVAAILTSPRHPEPAVDDPRSIAVGGLQMEGVSLNHFVEGTRNFSLAIRHVVWPEYAAAFDIRANKRDWETLQNLCRERDITLTLGTQSRPGGGDLWRNIALTLDPSGFLGEHTKIHTVHFFDDGTPGTTALPIPTRHGKIGTPVCFDCDYEGVVRKMTAAGAEWFAVPIMDAEKWTARQHEQHAELFRIRACENGRWMVVCASSGVSQVIDPGGHVHSRLGAMEAGPFSGVVRRESALTFHTRAGWLVPWVGLTLAAACWIALLVPWKGPPAPGDIGLDVEPGHPGRS